MAKAERPHPSDAKQGARMLDPHLAEIIDLKLVGASDQAVANRYEVARSTVTKFVAQPMVRKAIDQAQHDLVLGAVRQASTGARQAITTLLNAIDPATDNGNVPWNTRVRAASEITRMVGVERIAGAMETSADTLADAISVSDSLREKAALMEARIVEAESIELPGLRAVGDGE